MSSPVPCLYKRGNKTYEVDVARKIRLWRSWPMGADSSDCFFSVILKVNWLEENDKPTVDNPAVVLLVPQVQIDEENCQQFWSRTTCQSHWVRRDPSRTLNSFFQEWVQQHGRNSVITVTSVSVTMKSDHDYGRGAIFLFQQHVTWFFKRIKPCFWTTFVLIVPSFCFRWKSGLM